MPDDKPTNNSFDLFGLAPYGEAINTLTKGAVETADVFLRAICLPAAEEAGLLLKDRVSEWRKRGAVNIAIKSKSKIELLPNSNRLHAHPRIVGSIIENGSWEDSDDVQDVWAGLLASSCTEEGKDESNLIFVNFLSQITPSQVRVLAYGVEKSSKHLIQNGLVEVRGMLNVTLDELSTITQVNDLERIDRELDHLRALGLLSERGGVLPLPITLENKNLFADIAPSSLAVQMYVRCQGSRKSPAEYFGLKPSDTED
jgi:hypothetical protein